VNSHLVRLKLAAIVLLVLATQPPPAAFSASALVADPSTVTLAGKRLLALQGTANTRDIGGYVAADGRRVKWGLLYRSDALADLGANDLEILRQMSLATITDFRSDSERSAAPDRLPRQTPALRYRTVAVSNPAVDVKELGRKVFAGELTHSELEALLDRRAYVNDPALRRAWGDWLRSLAEPGALPQVFHCTAGKDRTGFAAAIVLLALGVPRTTVMEDFLLSNHYLEASIDRDVTRIQSEAKTQLDEQLLRQVVGVSAASLQQAFTEMESRFGSVDNYLTVGLGLDATTRMRLRELLLE